MVLDTLRLCLLLCDLSLVCLAVQLEWANSIVDRGSEDNLCSESMLKVFDTDVTGALHVVSCWQFITGSAGLEN